MVFSSPIPCQYFTGTKYWSTVVERKASDCHSKDISVDILVDSRPIVGWHCMLVYIGFSLFTNNTKKMGKKSTEILV